MEAKTEVQGWLTAQRIWKKISKNKIKTLLGTTFYQGWYVEFGGGRWFVDKFGIEMCGHMLNFSNWTSFYSNPTTTIGAIQQPYPTSLFQILWCRARDLCSTSAARLLCLNNLFSSTKGFGMGNAFILLFTVLFSLIQYALLQHLAVLTHTKRLLMEVSHSKSIHEFSSICVKSLLHVE